MSKKEELLVSIEIERSKLNREKSLILLDKALLVYLSFLFVGIIGFSNGYLKSNVLNQLIILGFGVLIVGVVPYIFTMHKEGERLDGMLDKIRGRVKKGGDL